MLRPAYACPRSSDCASALWADPGPLTPRTPPVPISESTPASAHSLLLLCEAGRFDEALTLAQELVDTTLPDDRPEAHGRLGDLLLAVGRLSDAEAAYKHALTLRPQYPDALHGLGRALQGQARLEEAELAYRLAIAVKPDHVEAHNRLGCLLRDLGRFSDAEASFRSALAHAPQYPDAMFHLGTVLDQLARPAEAEAAYRALLSLHPKAAEAHNNLGNLLQRDARLPEALAAYRQAIALQPTMASAHHNLGTALRALDRLHEAESHYRLALEAAPDYDEAQFSLATLRLALGDFEEGWRLYESRYALPRLTPYQTKSLLPLSQWQGESLKGRALLVWQEDGLGDMIQFGRYLPRLKAAGAARIGVVCAPALHALLATVDGVDAVLSHEQGIAQLGQYDWWTSLLSAPLRLGTTLDTIPSAHYLRIDQRRADYWRARLAVLPPGPRVGLVWRGNPRHHNDAHRSLASLSALTPLWGVPGVSFVSLQKGEGEQEASTPSPFQPLLALGHELSDFADTAALASELDLVVSVDTSSAHLAASVGTPCWVLLPYHDPDWRWLPGRTDSPWYPETMRVFRQPHAGHWAAPIEGIRQACAERFATIPAASLRSGPARGSER